MALDFVTAALVLLIVWLPLPFGSVVPWAHDILRLSAFLLLLLCFASPWKRVHPGRAVIPAAALVLIGLFGFAQAASWPIDVVRKISPEHVRLAMTSPFFSPETSRVSLSLAPSMTRAMSLTWLAAASLLLVGAAVGSSRHRRRWLIFALIAATFFQIVYGVRNWMSGSSSIWGIETARGADRLRGTFINADHLALYLELALAVVFAWAWVAARKISRRQRIEDRITVLAPPVLLWLTFFAALAFTGSRAGLMAAIIGATVQGLLIAFRQRRWQVATAGILTPLVGITLVAVIGLQAGFGRWMGTSQNELSWNSRLEVYRASLDLWSRFPITGTGLASFREAFPMVQPVGLGRSWWHAHNDFIEILATTGVVGSAILFIGLVVLVFHLLKTVRNSERSEKAATGIAALGACAAVAIHSMLDFGLTMPANALTLAVICGIGLCGTKGSPDLE